eukprot:1158829-Pelagomonas_calceolata.AAC.5
MAANNSEEDFRSQGYYSFLECHARVRSKASAILLVSRCYAPGPGYTLPLQSSKYMFLDLPHNVIRNVARFRLRVTLYVLKQQLGLPVLPLIVTYARQTIASKMNSMPFSFVPTLT